MTTFTVSVTREVEVKAGWAAIVVPIWGGEDEPEHVSDVETAVVEVSPETVKVVGGAVCVAAGEGEMWTPCDAGQWADDSFVADDTHDLRSHLFETKAEAEEHAASVEQQFRHPLPWQSFVRV